MSVVTIRGQLGSGAPEIGKLVADKLSTDYVDREIIAKVAELLNRKTQDVIAKEMPPGTFLGRIAESLGRGHGIGSGYEGVYVPAWEISLDDTRYLAGLKSIIKELAGSKSIVICGRGSQFILKDYPRVLHVLVVAPLEMRMKRVMESLEVDEESAQKEITRSDGGRREFIKRYFQAELEDPMNYDLVLNAEHLSFEAATSIIVGALPFKAG
ncbi:AAA family ATPase [Chloroflexota bacterium]